MHEIYLQILQVFSSLKDSEALHKYQQFLQRYKNLTSANDKMKCAMTDIAFEMTKQVWQDLEAESRGNCYFCIGGVNAINPFSATAVKNEIVVYVDAIPNDAKQIEPKEGTFYKMSGESMEPLDLAKYDEIYMDFNGSMAFFNEIWKERLFSPTIASKVSSFLFLKFIIGAFTSALCMLHACV